MPAYSHFDYYMRSVITAVLALVVLGVTAWEVLHGQTVSGPFESWAGLIIGVYFGQHVAMNGSGARRRVAEAQGEVPPQPAMVPVQVVPVATAPPPNQEGL